MRYQAEVVVGVWRYRQIAGSVYTRYNEHTKKVDGLAHYNGVEFQKCGLNQLIAAVNEIENNEGKVKIRHEGRKVRTNR
jgi:hypothetical protein